MEKISIDFLSVQEAWENYCLKNNILNPFHAIQKLWDEHVTVFKNEKGITTIVINDMTEEQKIRLKELAEYRDKFIQERELFKGQFILNEYGYNALTFFAQVHHAYDTQFQEWYHSVKPCEGFGGQCNLFCPIFCECDKNKGD